MNAFYRNAEAPQPSIEEAMAFLAQMAEENNGCPRERMEAVRQEIQHTGHWTLTTQLRQKLAAKTSMHWPTVLKASKLVCDISCTRRTSLRLRLIAESAFNNGKLKPVCSIFEPQRPNQPGSFEPPTGQIRPYRQPDGQIIGDPHSLPFTEKSKRSLAGKAGTHFDLLPLVIQRPGCKPQLLSIRPKWPQSNHPPELDWFEDLGLKWYAVPALSDMLMEVGGVRYTAAPFSGWYMCTEIGSRNFGDTDRYNLLPLIADKMGLSRRSDRTLWKDRALLELNAAVLHSFQLAKVTLHDHHTATQDFMRFKEKETRSGRETHADWSWIVPPMSGSACPVFHEI